MWISIRSHEIAGDRWIVLDRTSDPRKIPATLGMTEVTGALGSYSRCSVVNELKGAVFEGESGESGNAESAIEADRTPQPPPAVEAWAGSIEAAQGRPGASSSALRGRGSAGHRRRSARSYGPRGPRTGRPRLARQQLSGASWRRELSCAWSWGTRARRWLGALVQFTGCAAAARAGSRDARVMTLGGAPRRRSPEAPRSRLCRK